jgi:ketosteroid isomerase-like protein
MRRTPVLLALLLPACTTPQTAVSHNVLLEADRAFDSATAARGLEGWVSFAADSGRQIDEHGDFITGPAAIREAMRGLLNDTTRSLRWAPDQAEISADGSLGYTWGRWTMTARDSAGAHQTGQGRYLTVWRRQPDGSWKYVADVGTDTR